MSGEGVEADQEEAKRIEAERNGLRKLWLALALLGLLMCLNVFAATQGRGGLQLGLKAVLSLEFDSDIPEALAGLWGVIFLTVFIALASGVLLAHARRTPGRWYDRFPLRIFEVPPGSLVGQIGQGFAIVVLCFAPVYVLGISWHAMLDHGVLCIEEKKNGGWTKLERDPWQFFVPPPEANKVRLGSSEQPKVHGEVTSSCSQGRMVDFAFPLQTYLFGLLSLGATGLWLASLLALGARQRESGASAMSP